MLPSKEDLAEAQPPPAARSHSLRDASRLSLSHLVAADGHARVSFSRTITPGGWAVPAGPPVSAQSSRQSSFSDLHRRMGRQHSLVGKTAHLVEHAGGLCFRPRSEAVARTLTVTAVAENRAVSKAELFWWILFGASGWWSCNAIFSELPLLMKWSPDHERLGSQLSMMTQLGNVFLIAFKALEHLYSLPVGKAVHIMMAGALLSLVCCAFFWDCVVLGENVPLLVCMVLAGGVGCMSNATYWPFMIEHPPICTKAMGVGMSTGGVMATMLAALQMGGSGLGLLFDIRKYFALAAGCQACLWLVVLKQQGRLEELLALFVRREVRARTAAEGLLANAALSASRLLDVDDLNDGSSRDTSSVSVGNQVTMVTTHSSRASRLASALSAIRTGGSRQTVLPPLLLKACSFCVHAAVYSVPSLLPFVASGYPLQVKQQVLLWMLVAQQWGETAGRVLAPVTDARLAPASAAAVLAGVWLFFLGAALAPSWLATAVPWFLAAPVLSMCCFSCYFSFGVLQTVLFVWARSADDAAELSSNMGFLGQCGALFANCAAFYLVNVRKALS